MAGGPYLVWWRITTRHVLPGNTDRRKLLGELHLTLLAVDRQSLS